MRGEGGRWGGGEVNDYRSVAYMEVEFDGCWDCGLLISDTIRKSLPHCVHSHAPFPDLGADGLLRVQTAVKLHSRATQAVCHLQALWRYTIAETMPLKDHEHIMIGRSIPTQQYLLIYGVFEIHCTHRKRHPCPTVLIAAVLIWIED